MCQVSLSIVLVVFVLVLGVFVLVLGVVVLVLGVVVLVLRVLVLVPGGFVPPPPDGRVGNHTAPNRKFRVQFRVLSLFL
jgi:hypothetical protein